MSVRFVVRRRVTRRIQVLAALAAAALTIGGTLLATSGPAGGAVAPAAATAATSTFTDDFDGPAGAAVDSGKWVQETGDNVNNHERQYYTSGTHNAALDGNGDLVITARKDNPGNYSCWYGTCQYTSARLNTSGRFSQAYGHFETRLKMSAGQGMWPAFWMLGNDIGSVGWPNSGEIDVMENIGAEPGTVHGTIHGPGYSGSAGIGAAYSLPNGQRFADGFHTFAVDWAPDSITWSVDGNVYEHRTPADVNGNQWVFNKPFFIILNLAVGGYWPGDPDGSTPFPNTLVVDYVHVTTSDTATGATGPITGLAGKCADVAGANSANGTPVQLYTCNGTNAQQWTVGSDGSIRALGKCMDVTSGSTTDGALVQLYDCNGTGAQKWAISGAHDIVAIAANKCLDVKDNNSADGARLQIWTCTGGANQKWNTPA